MTEISGGIGKLFDTVRDCLVHDGNAEEAERALDDIAEAFERRVRWAHGARGLAHRLTGLVEQHVAWHRQRRPGGLSEGDIMARGNELETRLLTELGNQSLDKMPPRALVELGVAVAVEMERRGITAFPVQLGGDGKIQGLPPEDG